jgi:hypothetical protein
MCFYEANVESEMIKQHVDPIPNVLQTQSLMK